jgi:hypothetical protein
MLVMGFVFILAPHLRGWSLGVYFWLSKYVGQREDDMEGPTRTTHQTWISPKDASVNKPLSSGHSRLINSWLIAATMALLSLVVMAWFMTIGTWRSWYPTTDFIPLLADGFRSGRTHLTIEPSDDLLALNDPYPYENRESVSFLWDASFYDGKYFLYWGPTPALLLSPIRNLLPEGIGDQHIGWFFTSGLVILLLLFVQRIWARYFLELPSWSIVAPMIVAGFTPAVIWLSSRMAVYETAIASGQFFFLLGLHMLFPWGEQKPLHLALAGIAWAFAVGSRITLGPVVVVLVLILLGWQFLPVYFGGKRKHVIQEVLSFLLPLIIGAGLLLWYNHTRFGSVFEFGHRYQLGRSDIRGLYEDKQILSLSYFMPNLNNYLLSGVKHIQVFPYVKPVWGTYGIPFLKMFAGNEYHTEKVTGLLISTPFIFFAAIPVLAGIIKWWDSLDTQNSIRSRIAIPIAETKLANWYLFLTFAVALAWVPILLYQTCATRYLIDVTPGLILLSTIGFWYLLKSSQRRALLGKGALFLGVVLSLYSAIVSILLSITGYYGIMEQLNPELFHRLTDIFTW